MFTNAGSRRLLAGFVALATFAVVEVQAYGVQTSGRVTNTSVISIVGEDAAVAPASGGQIAARQRVRDHRSYNNRAGTAGGGRGCGRNGRC